VNGSLEAPHAITRLGQGDAATTRDLVAPFVGDILVEVAASGYEVEVPVVKAGGSALRLAPGRGPATANATEQIVVSFLLVVSWGPPTSCSPRARRPPGVQARGASEVGARGRLAGGGMAGTDWPPVRAAAAPRRA